VAFSSGRAWPFAKKESTASIIAIHSKTAAFSSSKRKSLSKRMPERGSAFHKQLDDGNTGQFALSIATTSIWIFAYLADQFFPLMQVRLGNSGAFLAFAVMAAINFIFVLLFVPETKGYSLEQISHIWLRRTLPDADAVNTDTC